MTRCALVLAAMLFATVCLPGRTVAQEKPTFWCYDMVSAFDHGAFGKKISSVIRGKVGRFEWFTTYAEIELADLIGNDTFAPGYDTPVKQVLDHAEKRYDAQVACWGTVTRKGNKHILKWKMARRDRGRDEVAIDRTFEAAVDNPHTIPPDIEALMRKAVGDPALNTAPGPEAEKLWATGPNMLKSGDFEKGNPHPAGWDPFGKPTQHGKLKLVPAIRGKKGKVLEFDVPVDVATTYGCQYYSEFLPCEIGATYRFRVDCAAEGIEAKVFIKCYDNVKDPETGEFQVREVYRMQHDCHPKKGQWTEEVTTFRPGLSPNMKQYDVKFMRVMLYAFGGKAGKVWWDDAVLKKIADSPLPEIAWKDAPNLVPNGDFEKGMLAPDNWEELDPQKQNGPILMTPGIKGNKTRVLRFSLSLANAKARKTMEYASDFIPVEMGATYRFRMNTLTEGPIQLIYLDLYDEVKDPATGKTVKKKVHTIEHDSEGVRGYWLGEVTQFVAGMYKDKEGTYPAKYLKIRLTASHPEGDCYWDNAVLKKIKDPSPEAKTPHPGKTKRMNE